MAAGLFALTLAACGEDSGPPVTPPTVDVPSDLLGGGDAEPADVADTADVVDTGDGGAPDPADTTDAGPGDAGPGDAGPGDAEPDGDVDPGDSGRADADPADADPADVGPGDVGPGDGDPGDGGGGEDVPPDGSGDVDAGTSGSTFAPEPEPFPESVLECDAGDDAWVSRAIQAVWGRRPFGVREVRVWRQLVEETSRQEVLEAMLRAGETIDRWDWFFREALRVNVVATKEHDKCFGSPLKLQDQGEVAEFVRDTPPTGSGIGQFNMTDLIRSSLKLDDVSPMYRGYILAMMEKPLTGANVSAIEMDITRRKDFGEVFEGVYLHRKFGCLGCHNSNFSVTDHPDPAEDRFWHIPGYFEQALFGDPTGRPEVEVHAFLRHLGVWTDTFSGKRPWGWQKQCGRLVLEPEIGEDPVGTNAYFIDEAGLGSNVWQLEAALQAGFAKLREDGLQVDEATYEVDGEEAFAYLTAVNIVNQVWAEVMGYPLTIALYFPRTRNQRDTLWDLTERFVAEGFSLREVLRGILLDPRFNQLPSSAGCGTEEGYYMRPTFNPWTEQNPGVLTGNSVGDQLSRHSARTMLRSLTEALMWEAPGFFPSGSEESLWTSIGMFVKDAEPGFRGTDFQGLLAWEDEHGVCSPPDGIGGVELVGPGCQATPGETGCEACTCQACVCDADPYCCETEWDGQCVNLCNGDCGGCDAQIVPSEGTDFVTWLVAQAGVTPASDEAPIVVGDVVAALKDRLILEPALDDAELPLLEALMGVPMDTPVSDVDGLELDQATRRVCGVLASSAQFLLFGTQPSMPDAAAEPRVALPTTTWGAFCDDAAPMWLTLGVELTCDTEAETLSLAPYVPEPL